MIDVEPRLETEVISLRPAIRPKRRSSGVATDDAIVCGLAPGSAALTLMVGKSTRGSGATGRLRYPARPASSTAAASSDVAIGRRTNGAEMFTAPLPPRRPERASRASGPAAAAAARASRSMYR